MAWTNPRYKEITGQDPPRPHDQAEGSSAVAPTPSGRLLVALPRTTKGQEEELRIVLDEFQGHAYLSVRLWSFDKRSGGWWPVKGKGVSIRLREAEDVADALRAGLRIADQAGAGRPARARPEPRQAGLPESRGGAEFDEFADS